MTNFNHITLSVCQNPVNWQMLEDCNCLDVYKYIGKNTTRMAANHSLKDSWLCTIVYRAAHIIIKMDQVLQHL